MRHYLLESAQESVTIIKAKPLFFPVRFELPDEIKERNPASQTRKIEGQIIMRFYCQPQKGDQINRLGFIWEVTHLEHSPQIKGSPKGDECPIVITKFIGAT